ncbi:MAG: autotransporter outer membrane beta-barrel domain-containing protein, partial [Rhodoferax sp.]
NGARLTGWIDPVDLSIDAASTWTMTANSVVNNVDLAGAIKFAAPGALPLATGRTLTASNWVGNGGTVELYTVLGNDLSATDQIVIDGGSASGSTGLVIKHGGGTGAQTTQGIRVVETIHGGSTGTTAFALSPSSDGYRAGVGTIASGLYDYNLQRGGNGGVADDWYLSNTATLRPEIGGYLNNRMFTQMMQFHSAHDRQGLSLSQVPGGVNDGQNPSSDTPIWGRVVAKTSSRESVQSLSETSTLVHAGMDVARFGHGDGSIRIGVMVAYGFGQSRADNGKTSALGTVKGSNLGVYGTWYGDKDMLSGPYVDAWMMYGRFNNAVTGQGLPTENYKSRNLAASLEVGYSVPLHASGNTRTFIEPQGQLIVSDYQVDTHTERNGTVVSGQSGTGVTTRLGVRVRADIKDGNGTTLTRPFVEVNWWHGPSSQSVVLDGATVRDALPSNRLETKIGVQGNVSKAVSMWGSIGLEVGGHQYTSGTAQVGVKYSW